MALRFHLSSCQYTLKFLDLYFVCDIKNLSLGAHIITFRSKFTYFLLNRILRIKERMGTYYFWSGRNEKLHIM